MPFFSVLIPSYNRPELIGAAVASVLASDFADFELIISDDKSPRQAEIAAVLQPWLGDPRVRLHLQPVNLREAANREFLLHAARGEWQIILCDDDKLYPQALATLVRVIRDQPGAGIYAFGYTIIDEHDRIAFSRRAPAPLRISTRDPRLAREVLIADAFPMWFCHPATFCSHRSVREKIKPNSNIGIGDDIMFLIDHLNYGGILQVVPELLLYYRKMTSAQSGLQMNQSAGDLPHLISRAKILKHLIRRSDLQPEIAAFVTTPAFRCRLLYAPARWSGLPARQLLAGLDLGPDFACELADFLRQRPWLPYKIWLVVRRAAFFVRTFGWAGCREIGAVAFSRAKRRVGLREYVTA